MKKTKPESALKKAGILKVLLFMKLTIALLLISLVQVSAKGFSQSKITLKLNDVELKKVLFQIEKRSHCRFLYNDDAISSTNPKVDVNVENIPVTDLLNNLFTGTNLTYKVLSNNLIVLSSKDNIIQDIRITGKVTGSNGEAVPAATVRVKGTTVVTSADVNGNFSIVAPDNATLIISSVGFDQKEIVIGGRKDISVTLKESEKVLDQVVVIGYGTANKRDLTGSIVKIAGKEVADKPNTNPVASLQSKVAGLYVVNNGTPGKAPDIRIRGTSSIGNLKPLYIVDGIFQDNIDYLNPNDIESIEVLKDPSSLAIFGVKGATGAIAITSKKAKLGQTIVNYNFNVGVKNLVNKIQMVNVAQFDQLWAEENANNGTTSPDYSALIGKNNTDWIGAVTRNAIFNSHNLSVSGTTEKNKFNIGLGFVDDEGIIIHEKQRKYLLSFSDEYKVSKSIKLGVVFNTTRLDNPYDATNRLDDARKVMPNVSANPTNFKVRNLYKSAYDSVNLPIYSGLVTAIQNSGVVNPVLEIENTWNKTSNLESRYVGSTYIDVNLLKHFTARATWYADLDYKDVRIYSPLYYAYEPLSVSPYLYTANSTSVEQQSSTTKKFQQDYVLTYKNNFGNHSLTLTGGFTTYYNGYTYNQAKSTGGGVGNLPIPDDKNKWYITNNFGTVLQNGASSSQYEYFTASFLGRALYNYKNKYFFNASYRDDASSQIPEKNRHQGFWAIGAAWEISKEDFFKNVSKINYLKLKASTGVLGNQSTYLPSGTDIPYIAYPGIIPGDKSYYGASGVGFVAATPTYQKNPNLKWETINAYEVGIELAAFDNRLHFEFNYYDKTTNDMMTYINRDALGLYPILQNGGKLRNWGEEISATWNQKINTDLSLSFGGNVTLLKNTVLALSPDLAGGVIIDARANNNTAEARTMVGKPIGSFYGYVVDGLYQSKLDVLTSPYAGSIDQAHPGDFKYRDLNKDGVITDADRQVIGNPTPKMIYGFSLGTKFKNFSLDIDMGGVFGNDIFRYWGSLESPFQHTNYPAFKLDRWHGAGTSNWEPIISLGHRLNYHGSTYNIEDGSYFRIRNVQLGYSFNQKTLSSIGVKSIRVFMNFQNLKTWKNNLGYTPEFAGSATAFGFDGAGGAIPRVTSFGANFTF